MASNNHAVGMKSEYLAVQSAKIGKDPVGIVTFRICPQKNLQPLSMMLSRSAMQRIVEDFQFLLKNSTLLSKGEDPELTLKDCEELHKKLTD